MNSPKTLWSLRRTNHQNPTFSCRCDNKYSNHRPNVPDKRKVLYAPTPTCEASMGLFDGLSVDVRRTLWDQRQPVVDQVNIIPVLENMDFGPFSSSRLRFTLCLNQKLFLRLEISPYSWSLICLKWIRYGAISYLAHFVVHFIKTDNGLGDLWFSVLSVQRLRAKISLC